MPLWQGQLGNRAEASALLHTPLAGRWLQATLTRRHFHFQQPSCPPVCSRRQPQEPEWARLLPRTPVAWAHLPLPGSSGLGTTATVASDPTGHTLEAARRAGCRRAQGPKQGSPGQHHEPYSLGRHPWAAPSVGCSYWAGLQNSWKATNRFRNGEASSEEASASPRVLPTGPFPVTTRTLLTF